MTIEQRKREMFRRGAELPIKILACPGGFAFKRGWSCFASTSLAGAMNEAYRLLRQQGLQ